METTGRVALATDHKPKNKTDSVFMRAFQQKTADQTGKKALSHEVLKFSGKSCKILLLAHPDARPKDTLPVIQ